MLEIELFFPRVELFLNSVVLNCTKVEESGNSNKDSENGCK
jgi:hypothetical protein